MFRFCAPVFVLTSLAAASAFAQSADIEAGKRTYTRRCASCHGTNGEGRPATARSYGVQMRHLGSPEVQALSDEQWRKLLKDGGIKAKPVRSLSDTDINNVIAYCRTFKQPIN
jgi:mono/diheme cytochrome c family protein